MAAVPITAVRTPDQLKTAATSEVESELQGQVAPLETEVSTLGTREKNALADIGKLFGGIQPHVDAAAQAVQGSFDAAQEAQAGIFSAAARRLNELKQSRAQEAQALAQQMGGPVAVGEFTAGVEPAQSMLANLGAGAQLHTNLFAQAGVQEANDWSGKVFPLIQTEETARARTKYEADIKAIEDQISTIKGTKSSKINARVSDMLVKEREFALQQKQQGLDKLKADRDWQATLRTLRNDEKRIDMAKKEFDLRRAEVTGTIDGKPTLEARQLTATQKAQARAANMTDLEYKQRLSEFKQTAKLAAQKLAAAKRVTWAEYLDSAINPQPGKEVKITQAVPVTATQAIRDKNAYPDNSSPTKYSKLITTTQTPIAEPITDPNDLIDYLVAHLVPKKIAVNMVKTRLNLPKNWVYRLKTHPGQQGRGGR